MKLLILVGVILVLVYNCSGGGYGTDKIFGPPDRLPLSRYDEVDVHVYFYYPNDKEEYLGSVTGTSACERSAYRFARGKGLERDDAWTYICCTIEGGSDCYRKIR